MAMGDALAVKVQSVLKEVNIDVDVVIPVGISSMLEALNLICLRFPILQGLLP